ncbi:MAG: sugar transferase [Coriobacteriales bacterium]|nr:sugar transferase [Coriobacteriales bacterium]
MELALKLGKKIPRPSFCTSRSKCPSPERLARRQLVDRNNMHAVYEAKPRSYKCIKRVFDVVASTAALVALSPVLLVSAMAIVMEDGLPVIYAAPREGKDEKPFRMYKLRSMYNDAEAKLQELMDQNEQTGPAFKLLDDPRITRVGRFLRRMSIDELPQLVNIIQGDMSIVGPRAIQHTQEFTAYEKQRMVVKPGLTCYWQVSGRARIDWDEWVELDLDYIQDMSVLTDLKLIAKTFGAVVSGEGSY